MKIGVMADSHANMPKIAAAIARFNEEKVALVLHAGDFISAITSDVFEKLAALVTSSSFDLVDCGYTHKIDVREGRPLVVNPG